MKRYHLFLSLISAIWFTGCTKNPLTPVKAKEQIARYYETKPDELVGFTSFEAVINGKDTGSNTMLFRLYGNNGLLRLKKTIPSDSNDSVYIFEITDKGKPYIIKEILSANGYPYYVVKTFDYYIADIIEVKYSPDKKDAAAIFDLPVSNFTPFGEKAGDPNHKLPMIAYFHLVDNNWILQRIEVDTNRWYTTTQYDPFHLA